MTKLQAIEERNIDSPLYQLFDTLGKKWTLHIIVCVYKNIHSFSWIMEALPRINTRILSERLDELVGKEYLIKKSNPKNEYYLNKKWEDLIDNLKSLKEWIKDTQISKAKSNNKNNIKNNI